MNQYDLCGNYSVLKFISVAMNIVTLIQIIAPILLIITASIGLTKAMIHPDGKTDKKEVMNLVRKGIALIIIFMIPVFIISVLGIVGESYHVPFSITTCIENASDKEYLLSLQKQNLEEQKRNNETEDKRKPIIQPYDQEKSNTQNVKSLDYINQGWYRNLSFCKSDTIASSGCGAVSFSMIVKGYSNLYRNDSNDSIVKEVRDWFCDMRGWNTNGGMHSSYMYHEKTLEHFQLKAEVLFKNSEIGFWSNTLQSNESSAIFQAVKKEGKSVILGIPGHWCVIGPNSKCSDNQVYMYDPSSAPKTTCYTMEELYQVTYNHKNQCNSKNGMCGWAIAMAFWSE